MSKSSRWCSWLWLVSFLPFPSAVHAQKPGQPFVSPLKNFTVPVPDFAFGTRVQKSNNRDGGLVAFISGFGDLQRIDYVRLAAGTLAAQDSTARLGAYERALDGVVRANRGEVLTREPLSVAGDPMFYALVRFPEASQVVVGATGKRQDSFRGMLVLARGEFLYTLSVEAGSVLDQGATLEKKVAAGREAVQHLLGTITFQGSAIPVVRDTTRAAPP